MGKGKGWEGTGNKGRGLGQSRTKMGKASRLRREDTVCLINTVSNCCFHAVYVP